MPRNGRVVVVIVLALGLSLGLLGSWFMFYVRPEPGAFIDARGLPDGGAVVIRHERGVDNAYVEVRDRDGLRWRGLIPRYAGTPGTLAVGVSRSLVTVRVVRGDHPHLFIFDTSRGQKVASFDLADGLPPDAHAYTLPNLATVSFGERSIEVLARPGGGARLILVELYERRLAWKADLATPPDEVWIAGDAVVARTGTALAAWAVPTGTPMPVPPSSEPPGRDVDGDGVYFTDEGYGYGGSGTITYRVPDDAVRPRAYHRAADRIWIVEPHQLTVLDTALRTIATVKE